MEWRPVIGYEGVYSVSDEGEVRREVAGHGAVAGRILRSIPRRDGYVGLGLSRGMLPRTFLVHALVAEAFLGPRPSPSHQVNHKDGVKSNNRAVNLEWVTPSENQQHASRSGLMKGLRGAENPRTRLSDTTVIEIRNAVGSDRELASRFGVHHSTIGRIRSGQARPYVTEREAAL